MLPDHHTNKLLVAERHEQLRRDAQTPFRSETLLRALPRSLRLRLAARREAAGVSALRPTR